MVERLLDTLSVIFGTIYGSFDLTNSTHAQDQQCHSTEVQWSVNQVKGQSHQAHLTKAALHRLSQMVNYWPVARMVQICTERWCTEAKEATQTHHYNPVAPAYPVWACYMHRWQRRSLPSGRLEKTTRSSPHLAQDRPRGFETTPPSATRSSRFGQNRPLWRMMSTYGTMKS